MIIFVDYQSAEVADVLQNRFPKNFAILTGNHLCWILFLIKMEA